MQTFVPYPDYKKSAESIDSRRLNKQLLEGRQILKILLTHQASGGWVNHPAVVMWRNTEGCLVEYLEAVKDELDRRGISTSKNWEAIQLMVEEYSRDTPLVKDKPKWWGDERVHLSHRQRLYVKDPTLYSQFASDSALPKSSCCAGCNYFWPVGRHSSDYL